MILGRIHSAMVSKVSPNSRSVTVEWFERGETKGKEVELDAILQLNADLFSAPAVPTHIGLSGPRVNNAIERTTQIVQPVPLSRVSRYNLFVLLCFK